MIITKCNHEYDSEMDVQIVLTEPMKLHPILLALNPSFIFTSKDNPIVKITKKCIWCGYEKLDDYCLLSTLEISDELKKQLIDEYFGAERNNG